MRVMVSAFSDALVEARSWYMGSLTDICVRRRLRNPRRQTDVERDSTNVERPSLFPVLMTFHRQWGIPLNERSPLWLKRKSLGQSQKFGASS